MADLIQTGKYTRRRAMSEDDVYKEKIDAELDLIQEKLNQLKAQEMILAADVRRRHAAQIRDLEQKCNATRARLREQGEPEEKVWEQLTNGVEDMWTTLQCTLQDTVTTFKEEKPEKERREI
jgi:hypothetical protein